MLDSDQEDFLVLCSVLGESIARCSSIVPSASIYLELKGASQVRARALFSREESRDVLAYVEVTPK